MIPIKEIDIGKFVGLINGRLKDKSRIIWLGEPKKIDYSRRGPLLGRYDGLKEKIYAESREIYLADRSEGVPGSAEVSMPFLKYGFDKIGKIAFENGYIHGENPFNGEIYTSLKMRLNENLFLDDGNVIPRCVVKLESGHSEDMFYERVSRKDRLAGFLFGRRCDLSGIMPDEWFLAEKGNF
jgi:hypothetical protein